MSHVKTTHRSPISILLSLLLLIGFLNQGCCFNFSFTGFTQNDAANLTRTEQSTISRGALQVTLDTSNTTGLNNMSARVLYNDPVKLWENDRVASFNSTFVLNIDPRTEDLGDGLGGDGLAFILDKDPELPINSAGQWLGLVNASTNGTTQSNIVAIEFDTKKSFPEDLDDIDNHVGLNINSIRSHSQKSLNESGIRILIGTDLSVMIIYNGTNKVMDVFVIKGNQTGSFDQGMEPTMSVPIDLSEHLPSEVYVGFSGSTGSGSEKNCVRA